VLKVLVIDDSALMRRLLSQVLTEAGLKVAMARNGREGVEQVTEWQPDVVTLDINMPEMDGLTALSLIMQARPTPVVMVSSLTERGAQVTLEALALGAVDYVAKPGGTISLSMDSVAKDLVSKVRCAAKARLRMPGPHDARPVTARPAAPRPPRPAPSALSRTEASASLRPTTPFGTQARQRLESTGMLPPGSSTVTSQLPGLVVLGVSTGGPRTLEDILPRLPADFPWPVLIAQHMPANFTDVFAKRMDSICQLEVREAATPMPIEPGVIYIARGGSDMVVSERLGRLIVQPLPESAVHPWHPSVDRMVETAMRYVPADRMIGVLLTGMGNDGAEQMARLRQMGGRTIAESADSAVVFGMPQELINRQGATQVLPATAISAQLVSWMGRTKKH
jgi:two-component system chemotaxis response regulator CheB